MNKDIFTPEPEKQPPIPTPRKEDIDEGVRKTRDTPTEQDKSQNKE